MKNGGKNKSVAFIILFSVITDYNDLYSLIDDLSDVVQCKPARSSSFCNVVFECQLVIENYTKITD